MEYNTDVINEKLRQAQIKQAEDTRFNLEQMTTFLQAAWKLNIPMEEVYGDMEIPKAEELTTKYPHYFIRVFDTTSPEYNSHQPNSAEFMQERAEIVNLVKVMRAKQEAWNDKEYARCFQPSTEVL